MARKVIEFGKWEGRPIRWLVIGKNAEGKYLCLTEKGLFKDSFTGKKIIKPEDCVAHHGDTWDKCGLRQWLNSIFIEEAFTPEERTRINVTRIIGDENPKRPEIAQPGDTYDKVFLISMKEAQWFLSQKERDLGEDWWLRTAGINTCQKSYQPKYINMAFVMRDGWLNSPDGFSGTSDSEHLVRPAIVIDM